MTYEIPEPVASVIAVINGHDEDGFLAAFTDDGYVDDWGRTFRGKDAIHGWSSRELIGAEGTLTVESVTTTPSGSVVVVGDWRSNHANGPSRFEFESVDQHVASRTIREG
jgi:hypothetical protein